MCLARALLLLCALTLAHGPGGHAWAQKPASATAPPTVPELVESAFRWGDLSQLERLYAEYAKPGLRSELTGVARVRHFWMGIGKVSNPRLRVTDEYYRQLDALTEKWARQNPQSVMAQLLRAHSLTTHAWAHRGDNYANSVPASSWVEFNTFLEKAALILEDTRALAATDSSWNLLSLRVGLGLGWDRRRMMAIFEDGVAKNPDHDELYTSMLRALTPKWGGDMESAERFIAQAVKRRGEAHGLEMYVMLYAWLSGAEVKQTLFTSTRASWFTMKAGFERLLARYPHVDNRNVYAYFACMASDRPTLQAQLEVIGEQFAPAFWGDDPDRTIDACTKLARQL